MFILLHLGLTHHQVSYSVNHSIFGVMAKIDNLKIRTYLIGEEKA